MFSFHFRKGPLVVMGMGCGKGAEMKHVM